MKCVAHGSRSRLRACVDPSGTCAPTLHLAAASHREAETRLDLAPAKSYGITIRCASRSSNAHGLKASRIAAAQSHASRLSAVMGPLDECRSRQTLAHSSATRAANSDSVG